MRFLIFVLTFLFLQTTQAEVWVATNQWDAAWEKKYQNWVQAEWQTDLFARSTLKNGQKNPYYGLKMDCADTVYTMRALFAFENKLPFVIADPTTTDKTISNKMNRWDKLREIERFRAFLNYLYGVVSTRSLPGDTYPVALTKNAVTPGSLILTTAKNHHSWTVKEILPIGVPWLVYNSVVGKYSGLMLKERKSWPNPFWVFEGNYSVSGNGGFRYWRPAAFLNKPVTQVPGFSDEQYRIGLKNWQKFATTRLATRLESDTQMVTRLLSTACEGLTGRVPAVNEALLFLRDNKNKCMEYPTYDTYSTPNRDRRAFDDLIALRNAYRDILIANNGQELDPSLRSQMNFLFPYPQIGALAEAKRQSQGSIKSQSVCVAELAPGKKIDLAEFKRRLFLGRISNNPHESFPQRWGESTTPSQLASKCKSWDPWTPEFLGDN
ncbi:MAG: hypothetical protein ACLGGX_02390 [Bdellovibrionia bacterium]